MPRFVHKVQLAKVERNYNGTHYDTYKYGAIYIRSNKLNKFIGKRVVVNISLYKKTRKSKENLSATIDNVLGLKKVKLVK